MAGRCCVTGPLERTWYPDVWDLAGGHVEPGEPYPCAGAELREELGVGIAGPSGPERARFVTAA
jgi:8-oxo-dGTP diphosphatase